MQSHRRLVPLIVSYPPSAETIVWTILHLGDTQRFFQLHVTYNNKLNGVYAYNTAARSKRKFSPKVVNKCELEILLIPCFGMVRRVSDPDPRAGGRYRHERESRTATRNVSNSD